MPSQKQNKMEIDIKELTGKEELLGEELGKEANALIKEKIKKLPQGENLIIDFKGVTSIDESYVGEMMQGIHVTQYTKNLDASKISKSSQLIDNLFDLSKYATSEQLTQIIKTGENKFSKPFTAYLTKAREENRMLSNLDLLDMIGQDLYRKENFTNQTPPRDTDIYAALKHIEESGISIKEDSITTIRLNRKNVITLPLWGITYSVLKDELSNLIHNSETGVIARQIKDKTIDCTLQLTEEDGTYKIKNKAPQKSLIERIPLKLKDEDIKALKSGLRVGLSHGFMSNFRTGMMLGTATTQLVAWPLRVAVSLMIEDEKVKIKAQLPEDLSQNDLNTVKETLNELAMQLKDPNTPASKLDIHSDEQLDKTQIKELYTPDSIKAKVAKEEKEAGIAIVNQSKDTAKEVQDVKTAQKQKKDSTIEVVKEVEKKTRVKKAIK